MCRSFSWMYRLFTHPFIQSVIFRHPLIHYFSRPSYVFSHPFIHPFIRCKTHLSLIQSFKHSFMHLFIRPFVHPFSHSSMSSIFHSFINAFIHVFYPLYHAISHIRPLTHLSIPSVIRSWTHSVIHSLHSPAPHIHVCFVHSFVHSFIHVPMGFITRLCIHSLWSARSYIFIPALTHVSFVHLFFTDRFTHAFIPCMCSLSHSFIRCIPSLFDSFAHWFMHPCIHLLVTPSRSFIHSCMHSRMHSFIRACIYAITLSSHPLAHHMYSFIQ